VFNLAHTTRYILCSRFPLPPPTNSKQPTAICPNHYRQFSKPNSLQNWPKYKYQCQTSRRHREVIFLQNVCLKIPLQKFAASCIRGHLKFEITLCNFSILFKDWMFSYGIMLGRRGGGTRGIAVGWSTALQVWRSRVRLPMVSLEFLIDIILPFALWPWGWLSLRQKWVPGIFPVGKCGWCVGLTTLPRSCVDCLEIWEPQTPGTLRACLGL
jgi:hypothetical protein